MSDEKENDETDPQTWFLCPYCKVFYQVASYRWHCNGCSDTEDELPEKFDDFVKRMGALGGVYTCENLPSVHDPKTGQII